VLHPLWPTLRAEGLKARAAEAYDDFEECKRVGDVAGPQRLFKASQAHAHRLEEELGKLNSAVAPRDEARVRLIGEVAAILKGLAIRVQLFLVLKKSGAQASLDPFLRLEEAARNKVASIPRRPAGPGSGTGDGQGSAQVRAAPTQRDKRTIRWVMHFNTSTGRNYLNQLAGLGAILAIPVRESDSDRQYKVVRNLLRKPVELLDEDLKKIGRISWYDGKPANVAAIMAALGLRLRPSHFVVILPEKVEAQLYAMEKTCAQGRPEDDILETHFRVVFVGGRYVPVIESIKFK
jgi:hypothetical protein